MAARTPSSLSAARQMLGLFPVIQEGYAELVLPGTDADMATTTDGYSGSGSGFEFESSGSGFEDIDDGIAVEKVRMVARHFFKCPFQDACLQAAVGPLSTRLTQPAISCAPEFTGILCAVCASEHAQTSSGCVQCGSTTEVVIKSLIFFILAAVVGLAGWKLINCSKRRTAGFVLWIGVAQR
eukprot:SAG22_NODE_4201_length_1348_cov_1.243395_2_plen_182_part_00